MGYGTTVKEDVAVIKVIVHKLDKCISGNGEKGLQTDVIVLQETAKHQNDSIGELRVIVSGLTKYVTEDSVGNRIKMTIFQKAIAVIAAFVAVGGFVLGIINVI